MSRRTFQLTCLVLSIVFLSTSFAANIYFDNGSGDDMWDTALNWSTNTVPTSSDVARIWTNATELNPLTVDSTVSATCNTLEINGDAYSSQKAYLYMTGGTLETVGDYRLGLNGGNAGGVVDMYGGTATVGDDLFISSWGPGQFNMYGGIVNVDDYLYLASASGTYTDGEFNLYGGRITAANIYGVSGKTTLDIYNGTLVLDGNDVTTVNSYISDGTIIGFNGTGVVKAEYVSDEDVTYVYATRVVGYNTGGWESIYSNCTHIIMAFQRINSDGSLGTLTCGTSNLSSVVSNSHAAGIEVLISVGGSYEGQEEAFETIAVSSALRTTLIGNLDNLVDTYGLDGVDIDWESPNSVTASDYEDLMEDVYAHFHPNDILVTTALSVRALYISWIPTTVYDDLDFINVMAYGVRAERLTYDVFAEGIDNWLDHDLPPEKCVMGLPFYGRELDTEGTRNYSWLVSTDSNAPYKDTVSNYFYNGFGLIKRKTRLALANDCGGVMIWTPNQDTVSDANTSLLRAIHDQILLHGSEYYVLTEFDTDDAMDDWGGKSGWASYWSVDGLGDDGQLVITDDTQNTSVWYDMVLSNGTDPFDLEDYTATADIDASGGATRLQLLARVTDENNWYACEYDPSTDLLSAKKCVSGTTTVLDSTSVPGATPSAYTLSLEVSGSTITAKMINTSTAAVLATADDTDTSFDCGSVGFRVYHRTANIENFAIKRIE